MAFVSEIINPKTQEVEQVYTPVPNKFVTVRTDTNQPLGPVSKGYEILQNNEAFDFLDSLVGNNAKFETAGNYGNGKSFITMSTEQIKILDDDIKPYILFTNSQDGTSSINVMFTSIRCFCSNTLVRAFKDAINRISIRHSKTMQDRLNAARFTLTKNDEYLDALKDEAEKQAVMPFTANQFENFIRAEFTVREEDSEIVKARNEELINNMLRCYQQDDIQNYNNTVYKATQAIYDYYSHQPVFRQTKQLAYKNMNNVVAGMPEANLLINKIMQM